MNTSTDRPIDRWFANYSADHVNAANQKIHYVPVPGSWFGVGFWAAIAAFAAWMFYYRASRAIGLGMLAVFIALLWLNRWLHAVIGTTQMLQLAVAVFVLAWIAQFVGHKIEGKKPSFLTDLVYLLIGPAWILSKVYRKIGLKY